MLSATSISRASANKAWFGLEENRWSKMKRDKMTKEGEQKKVIEITMRGLCDFDESNEKK